MSVGCSHDPLTTCEACGPVFARAIHLRDASEKRAREMAADITNMIAKSRPVLAVPKLPR